MCNGKTMVDVVFLCTGNLCRSPSAALLLEQQLARAGKTGVAVQSAGTLGASFGPPERLVKEALALSLDLSDHVPHQFDLGMIVNADLVIGMSREHVREVVVADRTSFTRTFTLREIVRRGHEQGPRKQDESLGEWVARIQVGRRHADLIGDSADDDILDPMGGSSDDYRRMLHDVSALTDSLRQLAWP
jgi:protein-tyrosine phosphatase